MENPVIKPYEWKTLFNSGPHWKQIYMKYQNQSLNPFYSGTHITSSCRQKFSLSPIMWHTVCYVNYGRSESTKQSFLSFSRHKITLHVQTKSTIQKWRNARPYLSKVVQCLLGRPVDSCIPFLEDITTVIYPFVPFHTGS